MSETSQVEYMLGGKGVEIHVEFRVEEILDPLIFTTASTLFPTLTHFVEYVIPVPPRFVAVGVHVPSSYDVRFAVPPNLIPEFIVTSPENVSPALFAGV